jgi:hypothetical protein
MRAAGIICNASGFDYTVVEADGTVVEESDLVVPGARDIRGEQLEWILEECAGLLRRVAPEVVYVKKAGSGRFAASAERHEVEAVVQVAAYRNGVDCQLRVPDQIRASHVDRGAGAYKGLLARPDVAERSNSERRECFLYALTAIKDACA